MSDVKIHVTFINDQSNVTIGAGEFQLDQLPDTFEDLETTLHLQDGEWFVVSADPPTRSQYTRTKALVLRLRRVEKIDPKEILFSLPSICDFIPGMGTISATERDLRLAEDDWRQIEFVEHGFAATADEEIRRIRRIHEEARDGGAWREIHVRKTPEPPIVSAIDLADVIQVLGVDSATAGVAYFRTKSQIVDAFSLTLPDGPTLYGVARDGRISVLAFAFGFSEKCSPQSIGRLTELAQRFDLDFVHWCRCIRASANEGLFADVLTGKV